MVDNRAGRRYALAVYQAAEQVGAVNEIENDLASIAHVFGTDIRTRAFFLSPEQSREEKVEAFNKAFGSAHPLTKQLFHILFDKRREPLINGIRDEFERLRRARNLTVRAMITSATPLDFSVREKLETKVASALGQKVEAEYEVDPRLVGGVRVEYGGYVLDGSVRGAFRRLRESLRTTPDILSVEPTLS